MQSFNENLETAQRHDGFKPPHPSHPSHQPHPPHNEPGRYGMPLMPPPHGEPHRPPSTFAIDHGSIRHCVGKYTYIWLSNGDSFWFYPTHVGRKSISGYRYKRRLGWVYYGTDLDNIEAFYCAPY